MAKTKSIKEQYATLKAKADAFSAEQTAEYNKRFGRKLQKLSKQIKAECTHPPEKCEDFKWHHGYGKYVTGLRCTVCGKYNAWKLSGSTWSEDRPFLKFDD